MAVGTHPRPTLVRPRRTRDGIWSGVSTRRATERVSFEGLATMMAGDRRILARTGDLSEAGAYVHTDAPPELGETVLFTVPLSGDSTLATTATVVWIDTDDQGRPSGCGLAFARLPAATRQQLSTALRRPQATPAVIEDVPEPQQTGLIAMLSRFVDRVAG